MYSILGEVEEVGVMSSLSLEKLRQASHPTQLRRAHTAFSSPLRISLQNPLHCQQFLCEQPEICGQKGSCNFSCSVQELLTWIQLVGDTPVHRLPVSVPDFGLAVFGV